MQDMASKPRMIYHAPWAVYAMDWSNKPDRPYRLAIGSFVEEYKNKMQILEMDPLSGCVNCSAEIDHSYPMTKVKWIPRNAEHDLIATSGDFLRIWGLGTGGFSSNEGIEISKKALLTNNKGSDYCAPLTSFDWNEYDTNIIGTSSIDTTCTIWDLELQKVRTQLIAHDKEVYDIGFTRGSNVFASVGADGSLRMFDLRNLEHSTIAYETPDASPLVRLAWNKQDPNFIAVMNVDSNKLLVLDIRFPSLAVTELISNSKSSFNSMSWAPHSSGHLCSADDDGQVLVWEISQAAPKVDPILCYTSSSEINQVAWSSIQPDWIAAANGQSVELLRI